MTAYIGPVSDLNDELVNIAPHNVQGYRICPLRVRVAVGAVAGLWTRSSALRPCRGKVAACFAEVVDPRQDHARHDLHDLLLIALCTMLTGGKDCSDMALFGELKAAFPRQFRRLQGTAAIDGKTLRRCDRAAGRSPLHMLHAGSADQRLLPGQPAADGKSDEITAAPKLLELLSLKGRIVTADARNCRRAIAAKVAAPRKSTWISPGATAAQP